MKKLLPLLLLSPLWALSQQDCESFTAAGISYILPKGISAEGAYFTGRFNAGIGLAYTLPSHTRVVDPQKETAASNNSFDIFAYAGYKVIEVDYIISAFVNAGYTMGNVNGAKPFVSSKILFPSGNKAFSVEPFYIFDRGFTARATVYFRL